MTVGNTFDSGAQRVWFIYTELASAHFPQRESAPWNKLHITTGFSIFPGELATSELFIQFKIK